MLTKLIAALALCLALTITPLTASPAYAEGGCEGASWGVACGVGVPGYGGSGPRCSAEEHPLRQQRPRRLRDAGNASPRGPVFRR